MPPAKQCRNIKTTDTNNLAGERNSESEHEQDYDTNLF